MKKTKAENIYPAFCMWTPPTTIQEKAQYVKDNMNLLAMPIPIEKVDEMLVRIEHNWKEDGHVWHEWIEECYFNLKNGTNKS